MWRFEESSDQTAAPIAQGPPMSVEAPATPPRRNATAKADDISIEGKPSERSTIGLRIKWKPVTTVGNSPHNKNKTQHGPTSGQVEYPV